MELHCTVFDKLIGVPQAPVLENGALRSPGLAAAVRNGLSQLVCACKPMRVLLQDNGAGLCYKKCDSGWYSDGAALCLGSCPDGYAWLVSMINVQQYAT